VHSTTRTVLAHFVSEIVELDDDGICCGAGGGFSVLEPALAQEVRARKLAAIERARPDAVAGAQASLRSNGRARTPLRARTRVVRCTSAPARAGWCTPWSSSPPRWGADRCATGA
jgi:glycolate oxidase iron-sulfur subunit